VPRGRRKIQKTKKISFKKILKILNTKNLYKMILERFYVVSEREKIQNIIEKNLKRSKIL